MLSFYCKLILIEMAHETKNQKEIILGNGMGYLEQLCNFDEDQKLYTNFYRSSQNSF